jgi:hypothetical protein
MSERQPGDSPWLLLFVPFAFVLLVVVVAVPTSALAGRIFGNDPVASIVHRHPQAMIVLLLTGLLTLAVVLVAVLLGGGL